MNSRKLSFFLSMAAILCFMSGLFLSSAGLQSFSSFFSQSGSSNPVLAAKIGMLPWLCHLSGIEFALLAALFYFSQKQIPQIKSFWGKPWSLMKAVWNGLLLIYGLVALFSLNFHILQLTMSFYEARKNSGYTIPHGHQDYSDLCAAILQKTSPSARILIRTNRDEKYLLNYDLFPRHLYFYPDKTVPIADIPNQWLRKYRIGWILEIPDSEPLTYSLHPWSAPENILPPANKFRMSVKSD